MPRLNKSTYLQNHHQLKTVWEIDQRPFAYLNSRDQLDLHKYFQFASDKTETELIEHRRNVHKLDLSLPQRAGRAYAKLMRGERAPVKYTRLDNGQQISVRAVMRAEPDFHMLVKVCMEMALNDLKREEEDDRAA
jgi:hypothetical protein